MTIQKLIDALDLTAMTEGDTGGAVAGCYIGDLLSWVMGRAPERSCWITVMGNRNAIAVAKLADIACILLCEDSHLDRDAKEQADLNGIAILSSGKTAYELAVAIHGLLRP